VHLEVLSLAEDGGNDSFVLLPYVVEHLCIGCGLCEEQCPVEGESAIRIYR
jgi:ferredoxin